MKASIIIISIFCSLYSHSQIKLKSSEDLIFQSEVDSIINLNYSELDFNDMKSYFNSDLKFQKVLSTNASKGDKDAVDLITILKSTHSEALEAFGKDTINLLIHTHKKSKEILEKFKALEDEFQATNDKLNTKTDSLEFKNKELDTYLAELKSKERLAFSGQIEAPNKTHIELADCITNSAMTMGITYTNEIENNAEESSFIEGHYSYSYFVDNYESEAGLISFHYLYIITDGKIYYRFFDFTHNGSDTDFSSIGALPNLWNEEIGNVFTKKQYSEILTDIGTNKNNSIRMITKYCIN